MYKKNRRKSSNLEKITVAKCFSFANKKNIGIVPIISTEFIRSNSFFARKTLKSFIFENQTDYVCENPVQKKERGNMKYDDIKTNEKVQYSMQKSNQFKCYISTTTKK